MKSLKEIRYLKLNVQSSELCFARIKDLCTKKIDLDVYLPSKNRNLQRGNVWTIDQKRELILSIFMKRHIPSISILSIIDDRDSKENLPDILQVIDGKQRLSTMIEFLNGDFTIEIDNKEYYLSELPEEYQRCYLQYDVKAIMCYEDFDEPINDQDKIDWFKKINFFGTPMDQEHLKSLED